VSNVRNYLSMRLSTVLFLLADCVVYGHVDLIIIDLLILKFFFFFSFSFSETPVSRAVRR
jgi:hypothetical protein